MKRKAQTIEEAFADIEAAVGKMSEKEKAEVRQSLREYARTGKMPVEESVMDRMSGLAQGARTLQAEEKIAKQNEIGL
jgi:hypothetical protein